MNSILIKIMLLIIFAIGSWISFFAQIDLIRIDSAKKPTISFSFDDGSLKSYEDYPNAHWNNLLLSILKSNSINATFYVKGESMDSKKGKAIIETWNNDGHIIANHTYSHPYFNSPKVFALNMMNELLKTDSLINNYSGYRKLFRFPYLKEGGNKFERDSFRVFMKSHGYRNGHVTIDASDWYIDGRLTRNIHLMNSDLLKAYKDYYVSHIYDRAVYYEKLSYDLEDRHIKHTLLLHHNLAAALFLDDLIRVFIDQGWDVVGQDEALKDPIYYEEIDLLPAGESIIWSIAKASGNYENYLRYPPEDGNYEKSRMDALGL